MMTTATVLGLALLLAGCGKGSNSEGQGVEESQPADEVPKAAGLDFEEMGLQGRVVDARGTLSPDDDVPVVAAAIVVRTHPGEELVGEVDTDEQGRWFVSVAEPGTYTMRVEPDTIPTALREELEREVGDESYLLAVDDDEQVTFDVKFNEPEETSFRGVLLDQGGTRDRGDDRPIARARVVVTDAGGDELGAAMSDASGAWQFSVPGAGTYQVALDTGTVPPGATVDESRVELDIQAGQSRVVLFIINRG